MKALQMLRGLIPPSSRSFHQMYQEFGERLIRIEGGLSEIQVEQMRQEKQMASLRECVRTHDAQMKMFGWGLYRESQEQYDDARMRFFRELPKADDELRLVQLVCSRLLRDFDALCERENLSYWLQSGTLLGAFRHGGFVPWDDDVDLAMTRSDFNKLCDVVKESETFCITEVFDFCPRCRQIRFRYRDEMVPCFLDVFPFDLSSCFPDESCKRIVRDRKDLVDRLETDRAFRSWNIYNQAVPVDSALGAKIRDAYASAVEKEYSEGEGFLTDDHSAARSVVYGLDNCDNFAGWPLAYAYDIIFPLERIEFEDALLYGPQDPSAVLRIEYDDYLELPSDLLSHFEHVSRESLKNGDVQQAMRDVLR